MERTLRQLISAKAIVKLLSFLFAAVGLAACGGGGSADAGSPSSPPAAISPPPPPPPVTGTGAVTLAGNLQYEFVPPNENCQGLNFSATVARPIRGATVHVLNASSQALLGTAIADENGDYLVEELPENTQVTLQVRAELKGGIGAATWDVEVRDNFIPGGSDFNADGTRAAQPPYEAGPLYVLDGGTFDSGAGAQTRNLVAETGWNGARYSAARAAAPFAVLDAIYSGMRFITTVDPGVQFDPLIAYWSVNNKLIASGSLDVSAGELTASFYRGDGESELFLTGDAATDTEEFDDHVAVHEWGHYFEDTLSRTDSTGGPHAVGDRLDARLAFGAGWATAYAGMALGEPIYCDTGPAGAR